MDAKAHFSSKLNELLSNSGLSPRAFAKRLHVAPALVAGWTSGVITPQIKSLDRIAKELGVPITSFFAEDDLPGSAAVDAGAGRRRAK